MAIAPPGSSFGTVPTSGRSGTGNPAAPPTTRGGYTGSGVSSPGLSGAGIVGGSRPITSSTIDWSQVDDRRPTFGPAASPETMQFAQDLTNQRQWLSFYDQLSAPQAAWLEKNNADMAARLGMVSAKYGAVTGAARKGFDADMRLLDNQEQQHFVDVGAAARQPGLIDALWGVREGAYNTNLGYIGQQRGFAEQRRGFAGRQRGLSEAGAQLDYDRQTRMANDDFAARGAVGASGYGDTMSEFGRGRTQAFDRAGLSYENDILGVDSELAGLANKEANMGHDREAGRLNYGEDKAKAADRIKTLDLISESFGIKRDQLKAALDRGIAENGLGQFASSNQIIDMMNSNNRDQMMIAENVIRQAVSMSGSAPGS